MAKSLTLALLLLALDGCPQAGAGDEPPPPASTAAAATAGASATATAAVAPAPDCAPACAHVERCEEGTCKPACPEGAVYVPATGPEGFEMIAGAESETKVGLPRQPPHRVVLTRPFCMDATEVTVKAYKECVDAGRCEEPRLWGMWRNYPSKLDHPVNKVHWRHARTYCEFREQSLPTEAQWEWAATGGDGRRWAWGNEHPTCERADFTIGSLTSPSSDSGCQGGGTSPVGSHPSGDRIWPGGHIHDLSGNVWEWVLDIYRPFRGQPETDPLHLEHEDENHVVRGGGWNRSAVGIRVDYRGGAVVDYQVPGLGFRCVTN
jgi:formylglycine-generating enzyme required for sulfatase activity